MIGLWKRAEAILRGEANAGAWHIVLGCGLAYGGVMGAFGWRPGQVVFSGVKVPLLLMATLILSLPSYFIFNTLLGVRSDFATAWRAILASQAGLTIILASLAPLTAFWYASSSYYRSAIYFNALIFAIASLAAQGLLRRSYRPLIERDPRHRQLLRIWFVLYAFVGIQMGWNLRPFVGSPDAPVRFYRSSEWENAYVVVARMIWQSLTR